MSGAAGHTPEGTVAAVPIHLPKEHGIMQAPLNPRGDAQTFLTHFVGGGLEDDRYIIQRFVFKADGQIVPVHQLSAAATVCNP